MRLLFVEEMVNTRTIIVHRQCQRRFYSEIEILLEDAAVIILSRFLYNLDSYTALFLATTIIFVERLPEVGSKNFLKLPPEIRSSARLILYTYPLCN